MVLSRQVVEDHGRRCLNPRMERGTHHPPSEEQSCLCTATKSQAI